MSKGHRRDEGSFTKKPIPRREKSPEDSNDGTTPDPVRIHSYETLFVDICADDYIGMGLLASSAPMHDAFHTKTISRANPFGDIACDGHRLRRRTVGQQWKAGESCCRLEGPLCSLNPSQGLTGHISFNAIPFFSLCNESVTSTSSISAAK
jgi:hypothetical protein